VDPSSASFWGHLDALRRTLLLSLLVVATGIRTSLFFYRELFSILTYPLNAQATHLEQFTVKQERLLNTSSQSIHYSLPEHSIAKELSSNITQTSNTTFSIPSHGTMTIETLTPQHQLAIFGPVDGMTTTLKLCFWVGLVATSPFWLYFVLRFIAPAFSFDQRKQIAPFILSSVVF